MSVEGELQRSLRVLSTQAWDNEIQWPQIEHWLRNFTGDVRSLETERSHCLYASSRFVYYSKPLLREMLNSLFRDLFCSPLKQRIRRNLRNSRDASLVNAEFEKELRMTRFVGIGSPAESGAHLLYYFRQVNGLSKDLFVDLTGAFHQVVKGGAITYLPREPDVRRYVFFDDLVASGVQASQYLKEPLEKIRKAVSGVDLRFLSLFAITDGLNKINASEMFAGKAETLFELDETFRAFEPESRYFVGAPDWFDKQDMKDIAEVYGARLWPRFPLGFNDDQILVAFSHNTPDNAPPIFWFEGGGTPSWASAFRRYHKV